MRILPAAIAAVIVVAVLLGGATRQGYLGDVAVQIAACFLLAPTLWSLCEPGHRPHLDRLGTALVVVAGLLCFVQLLPIFPWLATKALAIPDVAGGTVNVAQSWWSRVSLTPAASWAGLVSAIVPMAVFVAVTQCDLAGRLLLWRVVLGLGGLALLLGILQMLQGPNSPLRFFAITNGSEAVGFFANRNHFAAQLYVTLALAGAWAATSGRDSIRRGGLTSVTAISTATAIGFFLLLTAGLALARSRAGIVIAIGVMIGIAAMTILAPREGRSARDGGRGTRLLLFALTFVVLIVVQFGLHHVIGRFETDVAEDMRWPLSWATFGAALATLPFGTGIGSFVRVYGVIEDPGRVLNAYANRAHNDIAEFLLETGLLGAALIALFLIWFWRRATTVWRRQDEEDNLNLALQRSATLAIGGLLLHALVDYGLRTTAVSTLFAFACGLLTPLAPDSSRASTSKRDHQKMQRRPTPAAVAGTRAVAPITYPSPGADVDWPAEWKPAEEVSQKEPRS